MEELKKSTVGTFVKNIFVNGRVVIAGFRLKFLEHRGGLLCTATSPKGERFIVCVSGDSTIEGKPAIENIWSSPNDYGFSKLFSNSHNHIVSYISEVVQETYLRFIDLHNADFIWLLDEDSVVPSRVLENLGRISSRASGNVVIRISGDKWHKIVGSLPRWSKWTSRLNHQLNSLDVIGFGDIKNHMRHTDWWSDPINSIVETPRIEASYRPNLLDYSKEAFVDLVTRVTAHKDGVSWVSSDMKLPIGYHAPVTPGCDTLRIDTQKQFDDVMAFLKFHCRSPKNTNFQIVTSNPDLIPDKDINFLWRLTERAVLADLSNRPLNVSEVAICFHRGLDVKVKDMHVEYHLASKLLNCEFMAVAFTKDTKREIIGFVIDNSHKIICCSPTRLDVGNIPVDDSLAVTTDVKLRCEGNIKNIIFIAGYKLGNVHYNCKRRVHMTDDVSVYYNSRIFTIRDNELIIDDVRSGITTTTMTIIKDDVTTFKKVAKNSGDKEIIEAIDLISVMTTATPSYG